MYCNDIMSAIFEHEDCVNRFRWYNINNGAMLTDAQEIVTVELPKLPKDDDGTRFWQWLRFLGLRREDEMEEAARNNTNMKNVIVSLRRLSADETERRLVEAREKKGARGWGPGFTVRKSAKRGDWKSVGSNLSHLMKNNRFSSWERVFVALDNLLLKAYIQI